MNRQDVVNYLDSYLRIPEISDYGPQGLQLESDNEEIRRIALAVDVSPTIIEAAGEWGADMLLVHHGILWRDVERLAGPLGKRVRLLLKHNMNLYAAHLPLDAHPEVGNNAELARILGIEVERWWYSPKGVPIGVFGGMKTAVAIPTLVQIIEASLNTKPRLLAHGSNMIQKIAIISGVGADQIGEAKAMGADLFLTGEMSHANYWAAEDHGINVIFAGHYATETVGVKALGQHLSQKFELECEFFDFPTRM